MQFLKRFRTAIVLILFSAIYVLLAVTSYSRESATWDEPQHLTAGYVALKLRDYRIDAENPPFLDIWAALPLLITQGVVFEADKLPTDQGRPQLIFNPPRYCHQFFNVLNDPDRLLYRARFMIVLLGLLLGVLVFCWARDLLGWPTACAALFIYCFEPNMLAHARLVTTDLGVTCFAFGTVYLLWRTCLQLSWLNMLGLSAFFALAQISKFTALLLFPVVAVLLLVRAMRSGPWACDLPRFRNIVSRRCKVGVALLIVLHLFMLSYLTIWAAYSFRYTPTPAPIERARFEVSQLVYKDLPMLSAAAHWVDRHRLLPNAASMGFLFGQWKAQRRATHLGEAYRAGGIWYYVPTAFVLKTPLLLLLLIFVGVVACARHWRKIGPEALFILVPMVVFQGVALQSGLNVCLRHVLPIYPFGLLLATLGIEPLLVHSRRAVVALLAVVWLAEFAFIYPHYLASFNELIGGPAHGYKYMADSSLDWGQDLKGLKRWMDDNGVRHINLAYFGTADPDYYGILYTRLPGTETGFARAPTEPPRLPGYVAVSVTHLHGVYFQSRKNLYRPLLERRPQAVIGHSIHVYWLDQEW